MSIPIFNKLILIFTNWAQHMYCHISSMAFMYCST
jgi:hypothetical protein